MPRIKFISSGWSAVFGAFSPGDTLTCGEAEARHFVVDAKAAEYVEPPQHGAAAPAADAEQQPAESVAEQQQPVEPAVKRARRAKG